MSVSGVCGDEASFAQMHQFQSIATITRNQQARIDVMCLAHFRVTGRLAALVTLKGKDGRHGKILFSL